MEKRDKEFFESTFFGKKVSQPSVCEYTITKVGEVMKEDTGYEDAECACEITERYEDKVTGRVETRTHAGRIAYNDYYGWSAYWQDGTRDPFKRGTIK